MDNLRVAVIAGVVVTHVATAYVLDIDWYYQERTTNGVTTGIVGALFAPAALFAMGVLFLVSGLLSQRSMARKGPRSFLRDRAMRLGIPILFYVVVLEPLLSLAGTRAEGDPVANHPWALLRSELWPPGTGVMWFVVALLAFSAGYAALAFLRPHRVPGSAPLRPLHLVGAGAVIVAGSFVVRLFWPFTRATPFALNLWEWPQMATLFAFGVVAGERGWLEPFPTWLRRTCRRATVVGVLGSLAVLGAVSGAGDEDAFLGGWHAQALAEPLVEAVISIATSLLVLDWFARRWTQDGPLARSLGRASFAAYLVHAPVIVMLSVALSSAAVVVEIKFVVVVVAGVVGSFTLGWLLTRIRVLARVL